MLNMQEISHHKLNKNKFYRNTNCSHMQKLYVLNLRQSVFCKVCCYPIYWCGNLYIFNTTLKFLLRCRGSCRDVAVGPLQCVSSEA